MADEMCTTTTNPLQEEFCCFDGKVKRCKGHTTLTASVYHPFLQKQVVLSTMECRCEDSNYVATFWREFNKAYKKANSIEQKFLPFVWITDMAGPNFNGLKEMYSEDVMNMIKRCEFHFKQSVNRQSRKILNPGTFKVKLNLKQIGFFLFTSIQIKSPSKPPIFRQAKLYFLKRKKLLSKIKQKYIRIAHHPVKFKP